MQGNVVGGDRHAQVRRPQYRAATCAVSVAVLAIAATEIGQLVACVRCSHSYAAPRSRCTNG